jgi:hypothetical protein
MLLKRRGFSQPQLDARAAPAADAGSARRHSYMRSRVPNIRTCVRSPLSLQSLQRLHTYLPAVSVRGGDSRKFTF